MDRSDTGKNSRSHADSITARDVGWRGRVALGTLGLGLLAVVLWRIGSAAPAPDHTYDLVPEAGRWAFPPFQGRPTGDPVLLAFRRDWGHPFGSEQVIVPGAWKARMTALCTIARMGKEALPVVLRGLDDEDEEVRDLAAQAIGYFGDSSVIDRLDRAIRQDPSATVRIYAAIARGAIAGDMPEELAQDILKHDPQPMVRTRLELRLARGHEADLAGVREGLARFDLSTMDSARVGMPAPDFTLKDLDGRSYRLSDFRGKKDVAVVFVYGVTCMFCTGQIGNLRHKLDEFEALGTQILVVEANDPYRVHATSKEAANFNSGASLPILLDRSHAVAATYGVAMQMNHIEWLNRPSTFLIDRKGILRTRFLSDSPSDRPTPDFLLNELRKIRFSTPPIAPGDDRGRIPNRAMFRLGD